MLAASSATSCTRNPPDANARRLSTRPTGRSAHGRGNYIEPTVARTRLRARYGCRVTLDLLSGPRLLRPNDW